MSVTAKGLEFFKPINRSREIDEAIFAFYDSDWLKLHERVSNDPLFHYTTLAGLRGILSNRSIWCGHTTSFNDPLEIEYGKNIISEELVRAEEAAKIDYMSPFIGTMRVYLNVFGTLRFHPFVACFCENGNLLSQWRGYADRGGGYSLGISFSEETRMAHVDSEPIESIRPFLRRVIYSEDQQRQLVADYIQRVSIGMQTWASNSPPVEPHRGAGTLGMQAVSVLLDMALSFKNHAFREEKEWRLVYVTASDHLASRVQFREAGNTLVPYRNMHIYDMVDGQMVFPLRSIMYGPTLESIRTRSSIEIMLYVLLEDNHPIKHRSRTVQLLDPGYRLR